MIDNNIKIDVIIPSCKNISDYKWLDLVCKTRITKGKVIFTGLQVNAAKNRNIGLAKSINEYIIMIDDDIEGFYNGWDYDMILPLLNSNIKLSSARLIKQNQTLAEMMSNNFDISSEIVYPKNKLVPSSAISFRKNIEAVFDEIYVGSGFEDTDFCYQINLKNENAICINNKCKLIHNSEKKNQINNYSINASLFRKKWGKLP